MVTRATVAAVGNFDGVHCGHQRLIARMATFAREIRATPGAVVFDPHPRRYFRPDDPPFLLTRPAQRDRLLEAAGARDILRLTFDAALAGASPKSFVQDVLRGRLNLAGVVVGSDFRFGKDRAGDANALRALTESAGMRAMIIEPKAESASGEKIGSSQIRAAIAAGDVRAAAAMLGRLWSVEGVVEAGRKLGRTIGFPTANLTLGELIEPRCGVYAVSVTIGHERYDGVANFGRRPTVGSTAPLLEAYLFDFDDDLYGREIEVHFVEFIRDERKFDGVEALKRQIEADARAARHILGAL